jgi:hypothetical protein
LCIKCSQIAFCKWNSRVHKQLQTKRNVKKSFSSIRSGTLTHRALHYYAKRLDLGDN